MTGFAVRRTAQVLVTFWAIVTMLFLLFRLAFPDPTVVYLDVGLTEDVQRALIERFGLDEPLWEQYLAYLGSLITGELGTSFLYRAPVAPIVWDKFLNTIALMVPALVVAYLIGPVLGVLLAKVRGSKLETAGIAAGLTLRSAPVFWTGMIGVMVFAVWLRWLPAGGMRTLPYEATGFLDKVFTLDFLAHLVLPMSVVAAYYAGVPMLLMRNTMLEVIGEDFVEFARARGLGANRVMYGHVARNSLLPVITQAAITAGLAVGGQVVIEVVFSWPGLGREMIQAVQARDYPLSQATFLLLAGSVLILNLVADLIYARLDPRVVHRREVEATATR